MSEPLLTTPEAAAYLRTTPQALHNQRYRGEKPGALGIRVGKRLLFKRTLIDAWLDEALDRQLADGMTR